MSESTAKQPIQWKWVIIGIIVGLIIIGASYFIVAPKFHSDAIQALVVLVGFVVTGAIVGYFSPGVTIREALYAGVLLIVILAAAFALMESAEAGHSATFFLLLVLGGVLAQIGGWIGEKLQGSGEPTSGEAKAITAFQWKWVFVGLALGFALNVLFVFLLAPVFNISLSMAHVAFSISFVVTGYIVGVKSPGVTLREPAVAGVIAVLLE
ncbi:MAG: hypothetical protein KGJ59_14945, partial [Bacteroidota bacterium]|nr:hypothetical protein [Bacteroidota bacterium]